MGAAVEAVLGQLDLQRVAGARVGGANAQRGVSGGERRRVSIAQELVVGSSVLLLDEATSGLDSSTARALIETLAELAKGGRMIATSLHQPSIAILVSFDWMLCLSRGRALWQGPPSEAPQRLAAAGVACPPGSNVADLLLDLAVAGDAAQPRAAALALQSLGSEAAERAPAASLPPQPAAAGQPRCAGLRATATELRVLLRREARHFARSPALLVTHTVAAAVLAVWVGVIYWRVPLSLAGFQNRAGSAFFTLVSFGFAALSALDTWIGERALLSKEAHRFFHPTSYFFVKLFMDLLFLRVIPALLYGCTFYWISGWQASAVKFGLFLGSLLLTAVATASLAVFLSMLSSSAGVGSVALSFILLQMCSASPKSRSVRLSSRHSRHSAVFGGFLSNVDAMPKAVSWLRYLSIYFYGFESMIVRIPSRPRPCALLISQRQANELDGLKLSFNVPGFIQINGINGASFLASLSLNPGHVKHDLACMAAWSGFYIAAACLLMLLRTAPPGGFFHRRMRSRAGRRALVKPGGSPEDASFADVVSADVV